MIFHLEMDFGRQEEYDEKERRRKETEREERRAAKEYEREISEKVARANRKAQQ